MIRLMTALGMCAALCACGGGGAPRAASVVVPSAAPSLVVAAANFDPKALAKTLFGAKATGSGGPAAPYGGYAKGCLDGGVELPETGPTWPNALGFWIC